MEAHTQTEAKADELIVVCDIKDLSPKQRKALREEDGLEALALQVEYDFLFKNRQAAKEKGQRKILNVTGKIGKWVIPNLKL